LALWSADSTGTSSFTVFMLYVELSILCHMNVAQSGVYCRPKRSES
jgi:hypothetical protein